MRSLFFFTGKTLREDRTAEQDSDIYFSVYRNVIFEAVDAYLGRR